MLTIHASRSRQEAFHLCRRYGFLQYHWGGRGIVRAARNIDLMTGIEDHRGLEMIGRWLLKNKERELPEYILDHIIQQVKEDYFKQVFPVGFHLNEEGQIEGEQREFSDFEKEQQQQYTFNEQTALVEAHLRIFVKRVLPRWMQKFKIVTVENDMSFPFVKGEGFEVIQSATIDWVLQEIETKDIYVVSFKSAKVFDDRTAKAASHDTQGLSETWAFEEYLRTKRIDKKVLGVKMLYLIKGARKETERGARVYYQDSPLIKGWKRVTLSGIEYAHSWFYPKPENKSGVGAIGNSWQRFDVFQGEGLEEVGGVKGWIEMLEGGEIQPECGDVVGSQIVEPLPYGRQMLDLESWLRQSKAMEKELAWKIIRPTITNDPTIIAEFVDEEFPQNRRACHYPNDCQYLSVCWGTQEERLNPLENGFEWRVGHHKAERLYQIQQEGKG